MRRKASQHRVPMFLGLAVAVVGAVLGALPVTAAPGSSMNVKPAAITPGDWRQFRGSANHSGFNSAETILSPATVSDLQLMWYTNQGFNSSPSIADGVLYIANGDLRAYAADCATDGSFCSPLWTGPSDYSDWASPAIGGGVVYTAGDNGLSAFAVGCRSDGGECSPIWTGTSGSTGYTSPILANGMVYVVTNNGSLDAYDTSDCKAAGGTCSPTWTAPLGGMVESTPAVADGVLYVGSGDGYLNAFAVDCATGGDSCLPIWRGFLRGVPHSSPAVVDGVVYISSTPGRLSAFAVGCGVGGAECDPLWTGRMAGYSHSSPAVADGVVYVASARRVYAFSVGCASNGHSCSPLWRSKRSPVGGIIASAPAVANGVVYVGTQGKHQNNGRVWALAVGCGSGGSTCNPIWISPPTGGMVNASPAVSNGMLYFASNSGMVYAYGLPDAP